MAAAYWAVRAAASASAEGTARPLGSTFTVPSMPGWTRQRNRKVPAFVTFSLYGLNAGAERPEVVYILPSGELPPWGKAWAGWRSRLGWPLNQNGTPAAS